MCVCVFFFKHHNLTAGAQLNTAGVDFIKVALDGLQVGNTITTAQLKNQLQKNKDGRASKQNIIEQTQMEASDREYATNVNCE